MSDERIDELRRYAERHNPEFERHLAETHPDLTESEHLYDGGCPWCRSDSVQRSEHHPGNAHESALFLLDEIERLRVELRRFQRIVIDHEILTDCGDLCMVLCAGPCQGFNTAPANTPKATEPAETPGGNR